MRTSDRVVTVHVVRHGRTALNAQGRFRGRQDPPLDDVGLAEVEAAADTLAGRPIADIASSPLRRARQTAEAFGLVAGREPFALTDLLDLDHGEWEGLTPAEAEERDPEEYARFRSDPRASTPPGGEPLAQAERRMRAALGLLAWRYPGEEIVAVSHEIPIRLLLSRWRGIDGADVWAFPLPTASVTLVTRGAGGRWTIAGGRAAGDVS